MANGKYGGTTEKQNSQKVAGQEKRIRSIAKSISYRITGTIITSVIVFLLTGRWAISLTVGTAELIIKPVAFYIHERVWLKIKWGKH